MQHRTERYREKAQRVCRFLCHELDVPVDRKKTDDINIGFAPVDIAAGVFEITINSSSDLNKDPAWFKGLISEHGKYLGTTKYNPDQHYDTFEYIVEFAV